MTTEQTPKAHLGRNVRHFRLEHNMSQEEFAHHLGAPWSQKKISQLENRPDIDADVLEEIARALKVTPAEIKEYSEAPVVNNVQNNYEGSKTSGSNGGEFLSCTFNPLDKLLEAHENERKLYEALLKEKDDRLALMAKMLEMKG